MKLLVQRVEKAEVLVNQAVVGSIPKGLLVFLGIHQEDTASCIEPLVSKLVNLRIFSNDQDKKDLSLLDVKGAILLVSQFTLYGDCSKGRRPDFFSAAPASKAEPLYEQFLAALKRTNLEVASGRFGAHMKVSLVNDGPITLILESKSCK